MQLNNKRTNNPTEKWAEDLKSRQTDGQQAHEKMLNITKYQRKANHNYSKAPVRMAIIKRCPNNKCWRRSGEKGTLVHCWWGSKLVQPLWKRVWRLLKKAINRVFAFLAV